MSQLGSSLPDLIGSTPLLRLRGVARAFPDLEILAKAEWLNPGGSVKDRAALRMLEEAERHGDMHAGRVLLDATSGNTGIAFAMLGAARGYRVKLCVPANLGRERRRILEAYGAELEFTPAGEGSDGAIRRARELAAERPEIYYYADQYSNPANWQAHYHGTGEEIWRQTEGRVTHFVAALGTSGTFTGVTRRLKERDPRVRCISLQPDSPFHGLEGLKHMASALRPAFYDPALADANLEVSTEAAYTWVRRLAAEEGVRVGISGGAALAGTMAVARTAPAGSMLVTVFPDNADKYLSERFWEEEAYAPGYEPAATR